MILLRSSRPGPDLLPAQWPGPVFGPPTPPAPPGTAEPAGSGASSSLRVRLDAGPVVAAALFLAFLLPPRLVVSGLGAAGRPALILCFGLLVWWIATRAVPGLATYGRQPVRVVLGIYVAGYLLSYLAGYRRVLDAQEASSADRTLLVTLALVGLALTTADGVSSRVRLDRLLKRLLIAALLMALVGHLQFLARIDLTRYIRVPGLSLNAPLIGVGERGGPGFARVAGTAGHYIEFGVLMAMVLPIAIHYALFARTRGQRQWRWTVVILIFAGIPFSISRSAIVAVAAGLLCLGCAWTLRRQFNALAGLTVMVFVLQALKPGLIGTIRSLFTNVENDPSIQNRTADYEAVSLYFHQRPWLGLGQGTAMPDKTVLLDNQILGQLVGGGLVGLVTLLLIFVVGFSLGRRLRRTALDEETRHLGQALASVLVVALVASFTFDSFYFTTFAATLFLALGALGALWRLEHTDPGREHGYTPVVPVLRRIRYARSARS